MDSSVSTSINNTLAEATSKYLSFVVGLLPAIFVLILLGLLIYYAIRILRREALDVGLTSSFSDSGGSEIYWKEQEDFADMYNNGGWEEAHRMNKEFNEFGLGGS